MIPRIAIINGNTLEATGLKSIITDIAPMVQVGVYANVDELLSERDEEMPFVHFFVSSQILVSQPDFFLEHIRQTIVLITQAPRSNLLDNFRTLNTSASEHELVKIILELHQSAHGRSNMGGFHHGDIPELDIMGPSVDISPRETEVLALVARGFLNKEIADRLCISLPTVISHRKNICEKLHLRSVSSLTIYAVTHGIVNIEEI